MPKLLPGRPSTGISAALLVMFAGAPAAMAQSDPFGDPADLKGGEIRNPLGSPDDALKDGVRVDENLLVDLHVNDEDLASVLQMLSIQSQRSIVTSNKVSATITANLYGVTFYEALDAILHVNGFGYIERGNFIFVYTLEEIIELEQQSRKRTWEVLTLTFLNAVDAAEFVTPLLSDGGQIKTNGKASDFTMPDNAPVGAEEFANASTLVVHDYIENIEAIKQLLVKIDSRPAQFLVEATVLQTALQEANAYGVDFSVIAGMEFTDFVGGGLGPLKLVDGLINGRGSQLTGGASTPIRVPADGEGVALQSTPGNVASGRSTVKIGVVDDDISAFLRLLDEVTDTTILSRPTILTLNRMPARVLVGRKVGYLQTTSTDTSTTQTVEFLDTGTQLNVRPFLVGDGLIRMELKPQVSEAVIREATDATGAAVTIPDEITNELTANVLVRDGQTIVLGGLFRESTSVARRQVPILGDVPWVGAAFRGNDDEIKRDEIIFMIKTTVMADNALITQGQRSEEYVADARTGSREGLLFFGREKRCQQYNIEAERYIEQGKLREALYCLDRSLALNAQQPDAIRMRERLLGEEAFWPDRSVMSDIISGEIDEKLKNVPPGGVAEQEATDKARIAEEKAARERAAREAKEAERAAKEAAKAADRRARADRAAAAKAAAAKPTPAEPQPTPIASAEPTPEPVEPSSVVEESPSVPQEPSDGTLPDGDGVASAGDGSGSLRANTFAEVEEDPLSFEHEEMMALEQESELTTLLTQEAMGDAGDATVEGDAGPAFDGSEGPTEEPETGEGADAVFDEAEVFGGDDVGGDQPDSEPAPAKEPGASGPATGAPVSAAPSRQGFFSFRGYWAFFRSFTGQASPVLTEVPDDGKND